MHTTSNTMGPAAVTKADGTTNRWDSEQNTDTAVTTYRGTRGRFAPIHRILGGAGRMQSIKSSSSTSLSPLVSDDGAMVEGSEPTQLAEEDKPAQSEEIDVSPSATANDPGVHGPGEFHSVNPTRRHDFRVANQ
jgi:hypothetical protein